MRKVLHPLAFLLAGLCGAAAAQTTPGFDQLQRDAAWSDLELARQRALAAQRDAFAAQQRYQAQQTIQSLAQASPYAAPSPATVKPSPTDVELASQAARLQALRDEALADAARATKPVTPR